jgi:hypothetical protein
MAKPAEAGMARINGIRMRRAIVVAIAAATVAPLLTLSSAPYWPRTSRRDGSTL